MAPTSAMNIISQIGMKSKSSNIVDKNLFSETNGNKPIMKIDNYVKNEKIKLEISWRNVIIFIFLHTGTFYGLYLIFSGQTKLILPIFMYVYGVISSLGVTAGAHRLWSHRSYKAKWPLRLLLILQNSISFQNSVHEWVRDHRVHHKFVDTNADPHNINRGFFFAHMGWLLVRKHEDVKRKGAAVDMSDLESDPIVMFQKRFFVPMATFMCFILPTILSMKLFDVSFSHAFFVTAVTRYMLTLHGTWLVNSAAHVWGYKSYDKSIKASDNVFVSAIGQGEGWHNYHHVFPWDYKTSEMGGYAMNWTKAYIDFFAWIGWAYDLKTVSPEHILKRALRTGDGTNKYSDCLKNINKYTNNNNEEIINNHILNHNHENNVWGWDDKDMDEEDKNDTVIIK